MDMTIPCPRPRPSTWTWTAREIGRNFAQSIGMVADARVGLDAILAALGQGSPSNQWDMAALGEEYSAWRNGAITPEGKPLRPQAIMNMVDGFMGPEDLAVCDASLSSGWAAVYLRLKQAGRRYLAPRGLAGLGWGAPAAIGAALASPGRRVLHFARRRRFCLFGAGAGGHAPLEPARAHHHL